MTSQVGSLRFGSRFRRGPSVSMLVLLIPMFAALFYFSQPAECVEVKVRGYLTFVGGSMGRIPEGSRYVVKLQGKSPIDGTERVYDTFEGVADPANEGHRLHFELTIKGDGVYAWQEKRLFLTAVVNCGWSPAPGSNEWIRHGDFWTDTYHSVGYGYGKTEFKDYEVRVFQYLRPT